MLPRRFYKLFLTVRNSKIYCQNIRTFQFSYVNKMKNSRSMPLQVANEDKLLTELDTVIPSKMLLCLENNKESINGFHIVAALTNLHKMYKKEISNQDNNKFINWDEKNLVKEVLSLVNLNIDKLNGSQAVYVLDILTRMKMPNTSSTIQLILTYIYGSLNNLSLVDCCKLSSLIKKIPETSLIKKIQSDLPSKFIIKLSIDFEENNIEHLEHSLSFVSFNFQNHELLELLIDKLQNYNGEITVRSAILILESLCTMNFYPQGWINVFHRVQNVILDKIDEVSSSQVNFIIYLITEGMRNNRVNEFYNAEFLDKVSKKIITDDMGFETALSALKCFSYIRHLNKELLNYSSASYFEIINLTRQEIKEEPGKLLVLISALALARHKTIVWNDLKNYILQNNVILEYHYETLCILALNLICLNCYPIHILTKLFDEKFDYSQNKYLHWTFCKIYQILKINKNYTGPMPTKSQIKSIKELYQRCFRRKDNWKFKLLPYLEKGMGGSKYVKTNISTKLFHHIEHVVVFQKNGIPVPLNDDVQYFEDLKILPGCQKVAITCLPYFWFFKNSDELLGPHKLSIETLETISPLVVIIDDRIWNNTPDEEKTSLLMNKIKLKLRSN